MDWQSILALVGTLVGSTGLYGWYKARPEKISYEIKNLREIIEILKKEREEDSKKADLELQKLGRRLGEIEISNAVLQKAVQQWVRCQHLPKDANCPVSDFVDKAEDLIAKKVEELKQSMNNQ